MKEPMGYRLRPKTIDQVIGQEEILGKDSFIKKCIDNNRLFSMIFFGPPGSGKTTVAMIIASQFHSQYRLLNATTCNKKDIEIVFEEAKMYGHLLVIMDEVHRLNKDKQDLLLPHVENGLITLIGATTANPFHSINPAIRSRCHLVEFKPLTNQDIIKVLQNALIAEDGLQGKYQCDDDALELIAKLSGGDVRFALNNLEISSLACKNNHITAETIQSNIRVPKYLMDKDEDGHYDAVSAFQKSIRGSDVDASLYYLARLIVAGDMESIERRLLVTAYEDIGLGNPSAVSRVIEAINTAKTVGFPEASIPLSVAVIDLALSPKSKSATSAIYSALDHVKNHILPVPKYLRLTPIGLAEEEKYPYERAEVWDKIQYLPDSVKNIKFYEGNSNGSYERALLDNYKKLHLYSRSSDIKSLTKK